MAAGGVAAGQAAGEVDTLTGVGVRKARGVGADELRAAAEELLRESKALLSGGGVAEPRAACSTFGTAMRGTLSGPVR